MTIDDTNKTVNVNNDKIPILKRRSDFNGQTVITTQDNYFPTFFSFLGNDSYGGFYGELGMAFISTLNLSFRFIEDDFNYGHKVNGTWTGRVAKLMKNSIDMVLGEMTHLNARMEVVSGGYTDRTDDVYFYFKKLGSGSASGGAFFKVFDKPLWLVITVAIIFSSAYLTLALKFIDNQAESNSSFWASVTIVLRSYAMVGYDIPLTSRAGPRSNSLSIWLLSVSFAGSLIFMAYNACLVSFLSVKFIPRRFEALEDLLNFPDYKIVIHQTSVPAQIMRAEMDGNKDWGKIYKTNVEPNFLHMAPLEYIEAARKLLESDDPTKGTMLADIIVSITGKFLFLMFGKYSIFYVSIRLETIA